MKPLHKNLTQDEKDSLRGHRQRLRTRYLTQDEDYMDNSRLLELLLTYAIPQKDVYLLANSLLMRFGDLAGVLDASVEALESVSGISESSAILINLVATLSRKKMLCRSERKAYSDCDEIAKEICRLFYGVSDERILILTFNSSMEMLSHEFISEGKPGECTVDNRKTAKAILKDGVTNVVMAHNHPGGSINPSAEDISAMFELEKLLSSMSVKLVDMFIVSGDSYFKMSEAARLSNRLYDSLDEDLSYSFGKSITPETNELAETVLKIDSSAAAGPNSE